MGSDSSCVPTTKVVDEINTLLKLLKVMHLNYAIISGAMGLHLQLVLTFNTLSNLLRMHLICEAFHFVKIEMF